MTDIVLEDTAWGTAIALLSLLALVLTVVVIVAARRPVYFRMALRNAFRRPSQTRSAPSNRSACANSSRAKKDCGSNIFPGSKLNTRYDKK